MNEIFRQRGPWTICLCHLPIGQRPSTEIINVTGRISKRIARQPAISTTVSGKWCCFRISWIISTTVSGKWCCFRISWIMSMRLDPTVEGLCGTEGVKCWGCIGIVLRRSAVWEDADWVVAVTGATVETGVGMQRESQWCRGSPWPSGGFWGLWELEGKRTLGLSHPKIWSLYCPGSVVRVGRNINWGHLVLRRGEHSTRGSLRQRTDCLRFPEESAIL